MKALLVSLGLLVGVGTAAGTAFVEHGEICAVAALDAQGNLLFVNGIGMFVVSQGGVVTYGCHADLGVPMGRRIDLGYHETGIRCGMRDPLDCAVSYFSTNWHETISPNGQVALTCVLVPGQVEVVNDPGQCP
jgi:hypothetical protein